MPANKKNRDRIMDMERILIIVRWKWFGEMGEEVRGLRITNM